MGNKGYVSLIMCLYQTRICFVCSHLTSGHKERDAIRPNSDVKFYHLDSKTDEAATRDDIGAFPRVAELTTSFAWVWMHSRSLVSIPITKTMDREILECYWVIKYCRSTCWCVWDNCYRIHSPMRWRLH